MDDLSVAIDCCNTYMHNVHLYNTCDYFAQHWRSSKRFNHSSTNKKPRELSSKNKHTFIEENQHLSALYEMKEFVQYEVIDKNSIQPPLTFSYEGTAVNGMLSVRSITWLFEHHLNYSIYSLFYVFLYPPGSVKSLKHDEYINFFFTTAIYSSNGNECT